MTCHLGLDRDYTLTVRVWTSIMKEKRGDTAVTGVSVPLIMSGLSVREVTSKMKKLRMINAMNEVESRIQNLYGIRTSVSRIRLKFTHIPNTLLGCIDR